MDWLSGKKRQQSQGQVQRQGVAQAPAGKSPEQQASERIAQFDAVMAKNEAVLSPRSTPEALESSRVVRCHHFKHGKNVVEKNGPIQKGADYHLTGGPEDKSVDGFIPGMHPHRLPFGSDDLTNWRETPFQPIVRVTRVLDGVPYVVCGKIEGRSESGVLPDGKKKPGRPYVEGDFIAVPASEWSVALVPQLHTLLDTTPRVVGEADRLPQLEVRTDNLDEPLPEGWFDQLTKDMVLRVASGNSLSIQDWKMPQSDSLRHIFRTLICLPEEVARRMSFGSGIAYTTPPENLGLRMYHGMIGRGGGPMRLADKGWQPQYENVEKNKLGEEYLVALAPLVASAKTPRDVMKAVNELSSDLRERVSRRVYPK